MVVADPARAEVDLRAGALPCPHCGGRLRAWSWARPRTVRELGTCWRLDGGQPACAATLAPDPEAGSHGCEGTGPGLRVRPRRARCAHCRRTQVLLPGVCQPRRADSTAVIGAALVAKAAGHGHRRIAADRRRSTSTVRAWLRACPPAQAEDLWGRAMSSLDRHDREVINDLAATMVTGWAAGPLGQAMIALLAAVAAIDRRFPDLHLGADARSAWSLISVIAGRPLLRPRHRSRPAVEVDEDAARPREPRPD